MINEKKLVEYLESHIGENLTAWQLARKDGICEGMSEKEIDRSIMGISRELRTIAKKSGYLLDASHHDGEDIGMPYNIDFYIRSSDRTTARKPGKQ